MLYSAQTGGFYIPNAHPDIPEDAVEVSEAQYMMLQQGHRAGKEIVPSRDGSPVLRDVREATISKAAFSDWLLKAVTRCGDEAARARSFSSLSDAMTYANSPEFAQETVELSAIRDAMRRRVLAVINSLEDQEHPVSALRVHVKDLQAIAGLPVQE